MGYLPASSGSWAALTVVQNMDFVGGIYGLSGDRQATRRTALLERAALLESQDRLAAQLSGGMRRKLGFSMTMLHEPPLLVLDEPSTGVDPVSRIDLWRLVSEAAAAGAAVVMSTTYLDEAERAASLVVLDRGRVLATGPLDAVLDAFRGRMTLDRASGAQGMVLATGTGLPRVLARAGRPAVRRGGDRPGPRGRRHHPVPPEPQSGGNRMTAAPADGAAVPVLLRAEHVSRSFGSTVAVDDVTMHVEPGEVVGLLGANGAGKTTVIRMLLGLLATTTGTVELLGGAPDRERRRRLGYVPQGLGLYRDLTVRENLSFAAKAYGIQPPELPDTLRARSGSLVADLPLGLQRQLAFLSALAHDPEVLVLDEPTSGVEPLAGAGLWDTIHEQAERGVGVLVTTHNMREAEQCDRLLLMSQARLVAQGSQADVIGSTTAVAVRTDDWAQAFSVLNAADQPVMLAGRDVRVADADIGSSADCSPTPACRLR